jgi:hypothetical protein
MSAITAQIAPNIAMKVGAGVKSPVGKKDPAEAILAGMKAEGKGIVAMIAGIPGMKGGGKRKPTNAPMATASG